MHCKHAITQSLECVKTRGIRNRNSLEFALVLWEFDKIWQNMRKWEKIWHGIRWNSYWEFGLGIRWNSHWYYENVDQKSGKGVTNGGVKRAQNVWEAPDEGQDGAKLGQEGVQRRRQRRGKTLSKCARSARRGSIGGKVGARRGAEASPKAW